MSYLDGKDPTPGELAWEDYEAETMLPSHPAVSLELAKRFLDARYQAARKAEDKLHAALIECMRARRELDEAAALFEDAMRLASRAREREVRR